MNGTSKRIRITVTCSTCHERLTTVAKPYDRQMTCPECEATIKVRAYDPVEADYQRRLREPRNTDPGVYDVQLKFDDPPLVQPETVTLHCKVCATLVHPELRDEAWFDTCPDCLESIRVPARDEIPKKFVPAPLPDPGQYGMGVAEKKATINTAVFDRLSEFKEYVPDPPPKSTFFSNVFTYPWTKFVWSRWLWCSLGWTMTFFLAAMAHDFLSQGGVNVIAAAFFALPLIWLGIWTMSYSSACGLTIIEATAAGIDTIDEWPEPDYREWMANLLYLVFLGLFAIALSTVFEMTLGPIFGFWEVSLVLVYLLFPVILLSSLEAGSPMIPLTRPVLGSIVSHFGHWFGYYALSAIITTGWAASIYFSVKLDPKLAAIWEGPVTCAFLLIQSRLLGRLAWRTIVEPDGGKKRLAKQARMNRIRDPLGNLAKKSEPTR